MEELFDELDMLMHEAQARVNALHFIRNSINIHGQNFVSVVESYIQYLDEKIATPNPLHKNYYSTKQQALKDYILKYKETE